MNIYTIGHSNYDIEFFGNLLEQNDINCVIDVRSTPYSKYTPQFNKESIKNFLKNIDITYIHMGKEFGARRENKELYSREGYLDFKKVKFDIDFLSGIDRMKNGCEKGYNIALMCTEKDPIDCHRAIMITKELKDRGIAVTHIIPGKELESQESLEIRLLEKYYPNRNQLLWFSEENTSDKELIEDCYKERNKEIGCKKF